MAQIIHFLGWGAWQAWLLIVPVALFFRLVIEKFEGWSKTACRSVMHLRLDPLSRPLCYDDAPERRYEEC